MLDYQLLRDAKLQQQPYPHFVLRHSLLDHCADRIVKDFPVIASAGSVPVTELTGGPSFQSLIRELEGDQFRNLMQQKFGLNLDKRPVVITARGKMRSKDGRVHTDSKSKILTVLMYFNTDWTDSGGQLRILRSNNIDDYAEQIPPLLGTLLAFEATEDGWHGHLPVEGKRLALQLNYLHNKVASQKHQLLHLISARIKRLFPNV